jgi:hypothetical protein
MVRFLITDQGFGALRCGKIPGESFTQDEIPRMFEKELSRVTGIEVSQEDTYMSWNVDPEKSCGDYASTREFFLDDGTIGFRYAPKMRIPGERWRMHKSLTSNEISAVIKRIKLYGEGFFAAEERLVRWGLVMHISNKIQEFKREYVNRADEWARILTVLDVREEHIQTMADFTAKMHLMDPVHDPIPLRVLEVVTVFRILFRTSLHQFESAYNDHVRSERS